MQLKSLLTAIALSLFTALALAAGSSVTSTPAFVQEGTGAVARTFSDKARDVINAKDYGVNCNSNGTTGNGVDNAVALQKAIDAVKVSNRTFSLVLPQGVCRLASTVTIDAAITLQAAGGAPYVTAPGTLGRGTWLYFDHTGKGLAIDGVSSLAGIKLSGFGTLRNQPAPGPAWAPSANDYDIYIDNADVYVDDLLLLNPTKGIYLTNGGYGRLEINRLRGQAFQTLVRIAESYDVVKINNLHQWPFWRDDTNVHAYTMSNLDVIYSERNDNPMLANIFTIFARSAIRFGQNIAGKTSKMHVVNLDADRGASAIWVDATVTNGVTGQFDGITHQAETGLGSTTAIIVEGNNSMLDFGLFRSDLTDRNAVRIAGTNNFVNFTAPPTLKNYDKSVGGFPAIEVLAGNFMRIAGLPDISGGGLGGRYGGAGKIYVNEWRTYTPTITAETGTITTLGAVTGAYKRWDNSLDYAVDIAITTNGTGGGAVQATLPETAVIDNSVGAGREIAVSGKLLSASVPVNTARVDIRNYDNTYPGANGSRLVANGSIRIQ